MALWADLRYVGICPLLGWYGIYTHTPLSYATACPLTSHYMGFDVLSSVWQSARLLTGGGSRLLASRDSSHASAGGDHPPVGVDFVKKSGSDEVGGQK